MQQLTFSTSAFHLSRVLVSFPSVCFFFLLFFKLNFNQLFLANHAFHVFSISCLTARWPRVFLVLPVSHGKAMIKVVLKIGDGTLSCSWRALPFPQHPRTPPGGNPISGSTSDLHLGMWWECARWESERSCLAFEEIINN